MSLKIYDLPDEILMFILKKLYNVEVLYSLIGVNKQLNTIAHDSMFVNDLMLFKSAPDDSIHPLPYFILDRFLREIILEIHHKIKRLHLEATSMDKILLTTNYPSLDGLALYSVDVEQAMFLFTNNTIFRNIIPNEILSLILDINQDKKRISTKDSFSVIIFTQALTIFPNLQYLQLGPSLCWHQRLSFYESSLILFSSHLLELHVSVISFDDCLYLLNGRFPHLHTLRINIFKIVSSTLILNNQVKLPNLKCFSLCHVIRMHAYDELILPLLHRMLYLEELELDLRMDRKTGLVDTNDLKNNIINYMTRLKKFTFNIRSFSQYSPNIHLLSDEDIQSIFKNYSDSQIVSWCDHFPEKNSSYCHAHSYAYRWTAYENISNHFPGGLFKCVADVSLYDERPFEHEFFLQIGRSFPFMKKLTVHNSKPQKNRSHTEKNNCSIIKYPHLVTLDLNEIHNDYIEQFLLDTKMSLPDNVHLIADYRSLEEVTNNFTRDETRANCAKVHFTWRIDKRRNEYRNFQLPQHFKDYFPHADIEIHLNKTHQYLTNLYNHIDA